MKLTEAQTEFLKSYIPELLAGDRPVSLEMPKDEFVDIVSASDFDDGEEQSVHVRKVAQNLNEHGLFSDFDIHESRYQTKHIYLAFSEKGAAVMYDLFQRYAADYTPVPSP